MRKVGREAVGECRNEMLFVDGKYPVDLILVKIKAGQGKLKRGTILCENSDEENVILGTAGDNFIASYILAEDVDATEDIYAEAYRSGHFLIEALMVKEEYEITQKDKNELKHAGIYLSKGMK
jgi:hypothetical protein